MIIRINDAIAFARQTKDIKKSDLARKIWSKSSNHSAVTNFCNLSSGRTMSVIIDAIPMLCKELGVTADYLFGLEESPTRFEAVEGKREALLQQLTTIADAVAEMKDIVKTL